MNHRAWENLSSGKEVSLPRLMTSSSGNQSLLCLMLCLDNFHWFYKSVILFALQMAALQTFKHFWLTSIVWRHQPYDVIKWKRILPIENQTRFFAFVLSEKSAESGSIHKWRHSNRSRGQGISWQQVLRSRA